MGGRVDEGGSLENYCTGDRTPGSNPGPSAFLFDVIGLDVPAPDVHFNDTSLVRTIRVGLAMFAKTTGGSSQASPL